MCVLFVYVRYDHVYRRASERKNAAANGQQLVHIKTTETLVVCGALRISMYWYFRQVDDTENYFGGWCLFSIHEGRSSILYIYICVVGPTMCTVRCVRSILLLWKQKCSVPLAPSLCPTEHVPTKGTRQRKAVVLSLFKFEVLRIYGFALAYALTHGTSVSMRRFRIRRISFHRTNAEHICKIVEHHAFSHTNTSNSDCRSVGWRFHTTRHEWGTNKWYGIRSTNFSLFSGEKTNIFFYFLFDCHGRLMHVCRRFWAYDSRLYDMRVFVWCVYTCGCGCIW